MATPIPKNRAAFSLDEVISATGGELVSRGDLGEGEGTLSVSTDTRAMDPGALFVALRGETFDAHDHLGRAKDAGARAIVIERDAEVPAGLAVVKVASTLAALGALARAHARRWRALGGTRRTIAITGSAGKTTTRVATEALLERLHPGEVHATKGNLNNQVGAPMVLLGLGSEHRYAVIEIGTNRPGEIEALARMVEPEVGVLTLVAAAHVEELGSIEGVAREKGALMRALPEGGVAIGNGDDALVREQVASSSAGAKVLYGSGEGARACGAKVRIVERAPAGMAASRITLEIEGRGALPIVTPLLGEAGALACAAAVSAVTFGVGDEVSEAAANAAFAAAEVGGGAGRLVPVMLGRNVALIDDSYNANPASMRASIRAAAEIAAAEGRRLVLVLGEMRELGAASEGGHDEVGRAARESGAALVLAVGPMAARYSAAMGPAAPPAPRCLHVEDAKDGSLLATSLVAEGDLVLVKGSRGIRTDEVVRALGAHFGSASHRGGTGAHA